MKYQPLIAVMFSLFIFVHAVDIVPAGPVVLVIGTRPEAIKMIPLYQALKAAQIPALLCSTGQHAHLIDDLYKLFDVTPDIDLKIMKPGQDLFYITTSVLETMKRVLEQLNPALVVVQGDTTTAMASAMTAFYLKIPVAHVEAGLRSGNIYGPFPEEFNRKCISTLATYHFAPTHTAVRQLHAEQVDPLSIFYTGNTVVDALHRVLASIHTRGKLISSSLVELVDTQRAQGRTVVLLTAHRRESFDGGLDRIFNALRKIIAQHPHLCVIYPVHPNPCITQALERAQLDKTEQIKLMKPLAYHELLYVLDVADGVATDSGGITEEAISLSKPVLILRNETDRPEGLTTGQARLVGTQEEKIIDGFAWMLTQQKRASPHEVSPYGDGHACERIVQIIQERVYNIGNKE